VNYVMTRRLRCRIKLDSSFSSVDVDCVVESGKPLRDYTLSKHFFFRRINN